MLIRIQYYITAFWPDTSDKKFPADQDPVLHTIMLTTFFCFKESCRSGSSVMLQHVVIRVQWYITAFWFGSSGIKLSADQDPVLYGSMLSRFFWYKVSY